MGEFIEPVGFDANSVCCGGLLENNIVFTVIETDGASLVSHSDTEFDYNPELTSRMFLGCLKSDGVDLQTT